MSAPRRIANHSARLRLTQRGSKTNAAPVPVVEDDFPSPTKAEIAELDRIVADIDDPTRYLVVSAFTKRHVLYYSVEDNSFAMNRPEDGTAFKNLAIAGAVLAALSADRPKVKDDSLEIIRARKTKSGLRLIEKPVAWLNTLGASSRSIRNRKSRIENRKS